MLANSLILPTEQPLSIHEIKRALISYDKVYIPTPDDRELIPPDAYPNIQLQLKGFPSTTDTGRPRPVLKMNIRTPSVL